ncbi:MAG TPA: HmuY family protein [Gemmatimonadales bacterium]|nr:HmuY family protein [Gemmatimonadales bacterium]
MTRPPILVLVLTGAFLLLVTSLLIGSFTKPELPPYPLGATGDTLYTLDASNGDRWRLFQFSAGSVVDSGSWDIAFRRNHVITAPGVGALDLGPVRFDSVLEVPTDGYAQTAFDAAGDSTNPAIGKWYSYSMLSHLLTTKQHVYVIRTSYEHYVKVQLLAYYCREVGAACYTMRYKAARPRG